MVPATFHDFFVASTGAGAALVGLLFVAVSITPEQTLMTGTPVVRQALIVSAYSALLNGFFISLAALIPLMNLGWVTLVLSSIGLINGFILGWQLVRNPVNWLSVLRRVLLVLVGTALYGSEFYNAVLLLRAPIDPSPIFTLATLLVGVYGLGLTRAWQLLGGRNYRLIGLLNPLRDAEERHAAADHERASPSNKQNQPE